MANWRHLNRSFMQGAELGVLHDVWQSFGVSLRAYERLVINTWKIPLVLLLELFHFCLTSKIKVVSIH